MYFMYIFGIFLLRNIASELSAKELMLLNCGAEEDSWESLVLQADQISQS